MFWKSDETPPRGWVGGIFSGRGSITAKLTALYTLSAFSLLLAALIILYWMLANDLDRANRQFLMERVQILRVILREFPVARAALEDEIKLQEAYYARLIDAAGQTLVETPGMTDLLPSPVFSPPVESEEFSEASVERRRINGRSYLAASLRVSGAGGDRYRLQAALDVSGEEALVASYRRRLANVLFLGILLSAGAGAAVARRGMRPLVEITRAAERITAAQLHERIQPARWPRELASLATAFDRMLDRLEEAFTRLSQFSADLAHELRTPINNLMGGAEVALSRTRNPEEYREVIESSLEELGRLARMIDGLLFLARAENPETKIERSRIEARKEIEAVRDFHDALAQEQGVEVVCGGDAALWADPMLFRRAVSNLLSNALQYTPRGGKVRITAAAAADGFVEIRVSDTGCGIDPEHLPRVFDRFYRVDRSRARFPAGSGLGLAIVKSIMELHRGSASVQSRPAQGTTVILRFPSNV